MSGEHARQYCVRKGKKDWTALAWLMERRSPRVYGREQVVRIEDCGSEPEPMTLEQVIRWAERIEAAEKAEDSCNGQLNRSGVPDVVQAAE